MSNISSLEKLRRTSVGMMSLAIAIVVFTISSLYAQNGYLKLSFVLFPQSAVYVILGFFHAYNIWNLDNVISKQKQNVFMLFCYFMVYTSWYNVVLLPESGLGYIEWIIVFIVLTSNLITEVTSKKINNPFMGQRPLILAYFGVILFLFKMFLFYMFKDNIYDSMILNNKIARLFVVLFSILGIIFLLMQFYKHITNKLEVQVNKNKLWSSIKGFFKYIGKLIKIAIKTLASLVSFPVLIIIVASAGIITLGLSFAAANTIYQSILAFVEPLLEKIASTGENTIHPSILYYVFQIISLIIVLFYTVKIEKSMAEEMEKGVEQRLRFTLDNMEYENKEDLFEEAKRLLVDTRFSEQLRIYASNTVVKEAIIASDKDEE